MNDVTLNSEDVGAFSQTSHMTNIPDKTYIGAFSCGQEGEWVKGVSIGFKGGDVGQIWIDSSAMLHTRFLNTNSNHKQQSYAVRGESYTKQDSDGKYQIKGSYANAEIFTYYGGTESQIRSGNKNRYLYVNDDGRIGGYSANGMKHWYFDKEAILKLNRITLNNDCRIYDQSNGIFIETTNDKWLGVYNDGSVKCNSGTLGFQNSAKKDPNGWWKCGDSGLIIQWGKWNNPYEINDLGAHNGIPHGTNFTQNFAIPFSNACFNIMPNITNSDTRDNINSPTIIIHSFDKNKFIFQTGEHWSIVQNSSIYWLAIGY
ncbi:gp53-like domain-containing protein [Xenorhabdus bovienii]|uniref:gp53-like domain-containing protein n=1 Tax=Xenorhabdus bovienii TaxID=40576 RepID=UPI0023B2E7E9|nr:hypothetical protein [Xenorhabdus bovienii]MDE9550532.1 hypothetical protein [Xenorhabdus bovienii]